MGDTKQSLSQVLLEYQVPNWHGPARELFAHYIRILSVPSKIRMPFSSDHRATSSMPVLWKSQPPGPSHALQHQRIKHTSAFWHGTSSGAGLVPIILPIQWILRRAFFNLILHRELLRLFLHILPSIPVCGVVTYQTDQPSCAFQPPIRITYPDIESCCVSTSVIGLNGDPCLWCYSGILLARPSLKVA